MIFRNRTRRPSRAISHGRSDLVARTIVPKLSPVDVVSVYVDRQRRRSRGQVSGDAREYYCYNCSVFYHHRCRFIIPRCAGARRRSENRAARRGRPPRTADGLRCATIAAVWPGRTTARSSLEHGTVMQTARCASVRTRAAFHLTEWARRACALLSICTRPRARFAPEDAHTARVIRNPPMSSYERDTNACAGKKSESRFRPRIRPTNCNRYHLYVFLRMCCLTRLRFFVVFQQTRATTYALSPQTSYRSSGRMFKRPAHHRRHLIEKHQW
jgi:hypothetical protein